MGIPYMEPYYEYGSSAADSAALGVGGFVLFFVLLIYLLMLAFAVVTYVLNSLGMYTIARRRGIHHAWLAWIPVGDAWLLGSISDQYQYVAKGRVRNRRKVLLGLSIGMFAVLLLMFAGAFVMALSEAVGGDASEVLFGGMFAMVLLGYVAIMILAVIMAVFQYIALYDLFTSCDPGNSVLYLVLSILLGVVLPFFVFSCRNKDYGMPPRKPAPQEIPAVETAEVTAEEAAEVVAEEASDEATAESAEEIPEE